MDRPTCSYIPVECQTDSVIFIEQTKYIVMRLEQYLNAALLLFGGNTSINVEFVTGDSMHYLAIFPRLPPSINLAELMATFFDVLHAGMTDECPLHMWQGSVNWERLANMKRMTRDRNMDCFEESDQLITLRKHARRQQYILTSNECFHTLAKGSSHRIPNLLTRNVITYGSQMARYWQQTCANCGKNRAELCSQHREMMKEWVNACPCYGDVWANLCMQESRMNNLEPVKVTISTILKTLDMLCMVIDMRNKPADMNLTSDFLPVWTEGTKMSSFDAVNTLCQKFEHAKQTNGRVGVRMGGPMGSGKSWTWQQFLVQVVRADRYRPLSVLIVLPRISLSAAVSIDLRDLEYLLIPCHMELTVYNEDKPPITGTRNGDRNVYVTVVNSINKLSFLNHVDILILDEIETIIDNLIRFMIDAANTTFTRLVDIASESSMTMCMDATMSRMTPSLLLRNKKTMLTLHLQPRRVDQQTLIVCTVKAPLFPVHEQGADADDFFNIICAVAASPSNKIVICMGSVTRAYSMRALLRYNTDRSILVISGKEGGDACEQFTQCPRYDVTILTPKVAVGISESTCTFTHVFAYIEVSPNTMGMREYIQMLARVRHVRNPNTYVAFARPFTYKKRDKYPPPYNMHGKLAELQAGKKKQTIQWQHSGSKVTRDFITMWKAMYSSIQPETKMEQEPCAVPYHYSLIESHVNMHPGLIKRPTKKDRAQVRAKLMRVHKKDSNFLEMQDANRIHSGGCFSREKANLFMPRMKHIYNIVKEADLQGCKREHYPLLPVFVDDVLALEEEPSCYPLLDDEKIVNPEEKMKPASHVFLRPLHLGRTDTEEEKQQDPHPPPGTDKYIPLDDKIEANNNNQGNSLKGACKLHEDEAAYVVGPQKKRARLDQEKIQRAKSKHCMIVLPPAHNKCRRKCDEKFTEDERKQINEEFWRKDYNDRKTWMAHMVREHGQCKEIGKRVNRNYFLNIPGQMIETAVCQTFFLATLGYTSNRVIQHMFATMEGMVVTKDQRGTNVAKKDRGVILEHTGQYWDNTTNRTFISSMYNDSILKNLGYCKKELF